MDANSANFGQMNLQRRPGQRSGCSCCSSFMVIGLLALGALVRVALVAARHAQS